MTLTEWRKRGTLVEIQGRSIFVVDEGPRDAEVLVICHGYPSCSFDYWRVLPLLTERYRVVVHDHLGFGFSEKAAAYSYSLIEQADFALALWAHLGIQRGYLLGHDYGTSVVCEIVARRFWERGNIDWKGIIVGNGSMLIDMVKLLLSQKLLMNKTAGPILARLATRAYFHYNMKKLWADSAKYDRSDMDILYDINFDWESRKVFPKVSRYNWERFKYYDRWLTRGLYQTDLPVSIYWGDKDPVAVVAMAHRLQQNIPGSRLQLLKNVGHYPMLEAPKQWSQVILQFLSAS